MKSDRLKSLTIGQLAGTIIVLTLFSIALHEFGHFIVYSLGSVPVQVSLQSVRPIGNVDALLEHWAKFAGLGLSWLAAITFLAIAARHPPFVFDNIKVAGQLISKMPDAYALAEKVRRAGQPSRALVIPIRRSFRIGPYSVARRDTMLLNNECKVEQDPAQSARLAMERVLKLS